MFEAFVTLFSEADWLFYVLFIFSIGLFILQLFVSIYNISLYAGVVMSIATVIERCSVGENSNNEKLLYMIYISLLIVVCVIAVKHIIIFAKNKKNSVKYATIDGNKVPLTKEGNLDYSFLIGEEGEALTDLKPTGKVRFEKGTFEVTTTKEYIHEGTWVKADRIFNGRVIVKKK